jgi:hypothetical protein
VTFVVFRPISFEALLVSSTPTAPNSDLESLKLRFFSARAFGYLFGISLALKTAIPLHFRRNKVEMKAILHKTAFFALALGVQLLVESNFTPAIACDYYASPNGAGTGLSPSSPFQVAKFWGLAQGKTLCLLDGVYTGANSMITPPSGLNGNAAQKITIKALNDGQVRIDGQGVRTPIRLYNNDHFIIEGLNAANGSGSVISLYTGADNNTIRRVCAWNANPDANARVWGIGGGQSGSNNLLEDICGFGTGRRILGITQGGHFVTVRRGWFQWEQQNSVTGPQTVVQCCYHSTNNLFENIISTTDWTGSGSSTFNGGAIGFHIGGEGTNHRVLGSIFYNLSSQNTSNQSRLVFTDWGDTPHGPFLFKDIVLYTEQSKKPFELFRPTTAGLCNDCFVTNTTEIGGTASTIASTWKVSNRVDVDTVAAAPNVWNSGGSNGARVCKRYLNGILTSTPLWPWPMNQRIIDAMRAAGKTPVDITKTMEQMFGPIPSECRSGSVASSASSPTSVTPAPTAPTSLTAR